MEGPPVLGPCSWQSRGWREEEEEEEQPWERPPHLDKGNVCSKIQRWLRDCGAASLKEPGARACGGFEDELSPGAEALLLPGSAQDTERAQRYRHLSLGDSTASSVPSDVTSSVPSSFSLSQVLARCHSDPEDILLSLGFAGPEPGLSARVPPRFFSCPSRASGIDLGLFLRAQERRQRTEDTSLQLASRFQQVQALAATADAFFCLYSHVSRTPLQRIAAPRPYRDMPDSAEPRGARLKSAVTSLCLYTGRGHGDISGVLSEEDDEDDDDEDEDDEDDEAARSPHTPLRTLRSSAFQGPLPPWLT